MEKVKYYNALRVRLTLIAIVLITIPILILSFTFTRLVKDVIRSKYTESAVRSVSEVANNMDFVLEDLEEFSTVIISNSEILSMLRDRSGEDDQALVNRLRDFITIRDDIEIIDLIIDGHTYTVGAKRVDDSQITEVIDSVQSKPAWMKTKRYDIEILSGVFSRYYITLTRNMIDYNTLETYGQLMLNIEEDILENSYLGIVEESVGEVFVVDNDGTVISSPDKKKIGSTIRFYPYYEALLNNSTDSGYIEYDDEEEYVAMYAALSGTDWSVVKTLPTAYLYQEIEAMQRRFLIGGIVYGMVVIGFMIFFSLRYTEPMIRMMNVIKKVESGDFKARTNILSADEVGQLGRSLDRMIFRMEHLINQLIEEEKYKNELELEALHAQINPHFLYNTLNTIKWMAKIQGNKSVSSAITSLVKLLRVSINLGRDKIKLSEEIDYVRNYVVLQNLRFDNNITIHYKVDRACEDVLIPKLILQPIVENAIIYGTEEGLREVTIDIEVLENEEDMMMSVKDNGPGIEEDRLKHLLNTSDDINKFSKVGLNNVNERIKLNYGTSYGLSIHSVPDQETTVTLNIPMNQTGIDS